MNGRRVGILLAAAQSLFAYSALADQCPPGTEPSDLYVYGPAATAFALTLVVTVLLARRTASTRSFGLVLIGVPFLGLPISFVLLIVGGFTAPCVGEIQMPAEPDEPEEWLEGETPRLSRKDLVAADGSRQFLTWYDTRLGFDCQLETHWDDVERCYPQTPLTHGVAMPQYADSSCSKTMVVELCDGATPRFIQLTQENATTGKPEMAAVKIGAPIDVPQAYNPRSDCSAEQRGIGCKFHPVLETIPLAQLATAKDTPADDVGRSLAEAHDEPKAGTRLERHAGAGWTDTKLDMSCAFGRARDGEIRCLPAHPGFAMTLTYLDAACSEPALTYCDTRRSPYEIEAYGPGDNDPQPTGLQREGFAQLGERMTSPHVYANRGGRCHEQATTGCPVFGLVKRFKLEEFLGATIVAADASPRQ